LSAAAAFNLAAVILLFATISVAAVTDLLRRKVYNWLTYPAIVLGLTLGYAAGDMGYLSFSLGGAGLIDHLAGLGLGFGVFFVVHWSGGVGGGDVKLMAAIGAIMGFHFVIGAMFWGSLVGAVMAIWVLVWKGKLWAGLRRGLQRAATLRPQKPAEGEDAPEKLRIPYGTAIAFGTLWAWFLTEFPS
jgi:prepilin peptidase CpaA